MAIFPTFSKNEVDDIKLAGIMEKVMIIVFAIGIPIVLGGLLLSTQIMTFIFGVEYAISGTTFAILIVSLFASFPNTILTNVIFSKNLQKTFIIATLIGVVINIILNLLLIPIYGAVGAAISVTTTQILIMVINWYKLKKIMYFSIIPKTKNIFISSMIMTLFILTAVSLGIHILITIIIATVVYFISLIMTKDPTVSEVLMLIKNH
jgi:O-antigen/teichoic acid export membrane protein